MKKILKRLLTGILTLATVFTALPISQVQAASKSTIRLAKQTEYGYKFGSSYPAPFNEVTSRKRLVDISHECQ